VFACSYSQMLLILSVHICYIAWDLWDFSLYLALVNCYSIGRFRDSGPMHSWRHFRAFGTPHLPRNTIRTTQERNRTSHLRHLPTARANQNRLCVEVKLDSLMVRLIACENE
jgi:hypothetical protein